MASHDEGSVYKNIVSGLNEAIKYEKEGALKGARRRRVTIMPVPHYGANKIKSIRKGPAQRILELLQKESNLLEKHEIVRT